MRTHSYIIRPPKIPTKTAQNQPPKYSGTMQIAANNKPVAARTPRFFHVFLELRSNTRIRRPLGSVLYQRCLIASGRSRKPAPRRQNDRQKNAGTHASRAAEAAAICSDASSSARQHALDASEYSKAVFFRLVAAAATAQRRCLSQRL